MAFIDLDDQFIALSKVSEHTHDHERHFGLVVDGKEAVGETLARMGVDLASERFMDFYDPWGNRIEIVGYPGTSSPRPTTFSVAWECRASARRTKQSRNSQKKEWARASTKRRRYPKT